MSRCPGDAVTRAKAAARTLTTLVIALTSTVLITLAGCASTSGIASSATLVDPAKRASPPRLRRRCRPTGGKASAIPR